MKRVNFKILWLQMLCLLVLPELRAQIYYSDFITSGELDAYYKVAVRERLATPYVPLREADVKYTKRVVRCIDARQKMNKSINWPKSALNQHLYTALWEGSLTPYRTDSLSSFLSTSEFRSRLTYLQNVFVATGEDPTEGEDTTIEVITESNTIQKFFILEEWNFDYQHGVFKPRILAIAPIYRRSMSIGLAPEQPLCWVSMDQRTRDMMSQWEYFNRYNDAARLSFDDFFQMRLFDSYIVFESNVFDNYINQFQEYENDQVGALVKAEEVKNDLFIFEHDLWQY